MIDDMKKTKKKKATWKKPKLKNVIAESDERDGSTPNRIALPERVIESMKPCGTEQQGLWFTRNAIYNRVSMQQGCPTIEKLEVISTALNILVREGYVERALHPNSPDRLYIFRRTLKPFKAKIYGEHLGGGKEKVQRGFDIWLNNSKLPKWFRDMLH